MFYPNATKLARVCQEDSGFMELLGVSQGELQLFLIMAGRGMVKDAAAKAGFDPGPEEYYVSLHEFMMEHHMPPSLLGLSDDALGQWMRAAEQKGIKQRATRNGAFVE